MHKPAHFQTWSGLFADFRLASSKACLNIAGQVGTLTELAGVQAVISSEQRTAFASHADILQAGHVGRVLPE